MSAEVGEVARQAGTERSTSECHDRYRSSTVSLCPAAVLLLGSISACSTIAAPDHPRPPLPLPSHIAERYELPGPVNEDYLVRLDERGRISRGRLTCGDERPEFHVILPEVTPAPVLLCLPILAGGERLMWHIADQMATRGFAVVWGKRVASAMQSHQKVDDLEELMRRSIIHNRAVLTWAKTQSWADPGPASIFGISTGGILGGILLALEPDLGGGVLILAGGDLPDLLMNSSESRIEKWRRKRSQTDDLNRPRLRELMCTKLLSDPARTGPYVPTDKVLLVSANLDTVVLPRNQDLLWEALGRPERLRMHLFSHYSSILGLPSVLSRADVFLKDRLAAPAQSPVR